jgi:hypothetical protein
VNTYTVTLTREELIYCIKGVGALGMIWNKQTREETRAFRKALEQKLIDIKDAQSS